MKPQEITTDATSGIIRFTSPWSFNETLERIEAFLVAKKIKLFARIDQAAEAAVVGLALRPTTLLIFGDPAKGTPLMDAYQRSRPAPPARLHHSKSAVRPGRPHPD